jgi:hypothetical protein
MQNSPATAKIALLLLLMPTSQCLAQVDSVRSSDDRGVPPGFELLGTLEGRITEVVGYGMTPAGGARVDVHFEGRLEGKINGVMTGIDYALVREGFTELDVRAKLETDDGTLISVEISGFLVPDGQIRDAMVRFETGSPQYQWLHHKIVVGTGQNIRDERLVVNYYYLP